jgi:hypothetical protein
MVLFSFHFFPYTGLKTNLKGACLRFTTFGMDYVEAKCIRGGHSSSQLEAISFNIPTLSPKSEG